MSKLNQTELHKLKEAIGLFNSMIECGEKHSMSSKQILSQARIILRRHINDGS